MQVDEQHAAGEARDSVCDPLLQGRMRLLALAPRLQCVDIAFEHRRKAVRLRRWVGRACARATVLAVSTMALPGSIHPLAFVWRTRHLPSSEISMCLTGGAK